MALDRGRDHRLHLRAVAHVAPDAGDVALDGRGEAGRVRALEVDGDDGIAAGSELADYLGADPGGGASDDTDTTGHVTPSGRDGQFPELGQPVDGALQALAGRGRLVAERGVGDAGVKQRLGPAGVRGPGHVPELLEQRGLSCDRDPVA